jgi:FtsZ-interacting cell division protein ZipA
MAELRWILLVAGLVFLAVLAAWEMRKPRQAHRDAAVRGPQRSEPELGSFSEHPTDAHAAAATRGAFGGASEARRPVMPPTHIDLPAMEAIRDESMMAEVDALPVFEFQPPQRGASRGAEPHEPHESHEWHQQLESHEAQQPSAQALQAASGEPAGAMEQVEQAQHGTPATTAGPIAPAIDWPPEGQRHIVALRIVAASPERLSGRAVRLAITACGFVHGKFGIYHQPDADGRALLSVASLSKPGILDPVNMDFQRLPGISLFTVLPGPLPPAAALDHLLDIARELSQRLPARLQDEQGQPLDADRLENLRDSMQRLSSPGFHAEPAA